MKKSIPVQSVKRFGSPIAGGLGCKAKKQPPNEVEILNDAWLEALKHLPCPQWSKMRLVTCKLNGLVGRNVSRLPLGIIERAEIKYRERNRIEPKIIVADSILSQDEKNQWLNDHGMTIDLPADIQLGKAFIGIELKGNFCADLRVFGPVQKKKLTPYEKGRPWFSSNSKYSRRFKSIVLFYGEFRPHRNQSSLASMVFYLKLLYDPSTYIKELFMYSLETKLKDFLFPGEEKRHIRCKSFSNRHEKTGASVDEIREYISWLEQNVRADYMYFPEVMEQSVNNSQATERNNQICDVMTDFVFGASSRNVMQSVYLSDIDEPECCMYLFHALIKKFRNIGTAQSIFPRISFGGLDSAIKDSTAKFLSEKDTVRENVEKGCCGREMFTISNGLNRMRVHIMRRSGSANVDLSLI